MIKRNAVVRGIFALFLYLSSSHFASADSTWTVYNHMNSPLPSDYVASINFDGDGNQFVGTSTRGLAIIREGNWDIRNESNSGVPINAVRMAQEDADGNLWLAAASGNLDSSPFGFGLARLDAVDSTWSMHTLGLEVNQVVTGYIIDGQINYVSTYGGGITIYDDLGWTRYRTNSRTEYTYADSQQQVFNVPHGTYIPTDYIRAIDFDYGNGILWIATVNAGVVRYDGTNWETLNAGNSDLPSNQFLSIRVNSLNGDVAFGTAGLGVVIYDGSIWTIYNTSNSPMTNGFIATLEFRPGDEELWIGTGYGVWVLQSDGQWRGYIPPNNNFIWGEFYSDIAFDSAGSVWVAAYGGGIASLVLDSIPPPPPPPPPPPEDSLTVDVNRMFIYFFEHRPKERIFTDLTASGAPILEPGDSISFNLYTYLGELYNFSVPFDEFELHGNYHDDDEDDDGDGGEGDDDDDEGEGGDHHHHGPCFRYKEDGLKITLRYDEIDSSIVDISIKDFHAEMNRENYDNTMVVSMEMGGVSGSCVIFMTLGNEWDVPEILPSDDYNLGQLYVLSGSASIISEGNTPLAEQIGLGNYPNPFNGRTYISFKLPEAANVTVTVYDVLGRIVNTVYSGTLNAGDHNFAWPLDGLPNSGVYLYRISAGETTVSNKMLYLK